MPGVKRFDEAAVLDRLMAVFWARGYEAATIDDLVAATGVKRGSLYNAFGDKEQMFLAAVSRYAATVESPLLAMLDAPDPKAGVARLFDAQIAALADPANPPGCLLAQGCVEAGPRPDAIGRCLRDHLTGMEATVYAMLLRAQTAGRLEQGRDLRALARFVVAVSRALALIHRSLGDPAYLRDVAAVALTVFDGPDGALSPAAGGDTGSAATPGT